ncbi:MAG TPA: hypothetical protein VGE29_20900 [Prosthecobacter sp.]
MFDPLFNTLEQEAHVIRSAIGSGLTSLRKANLNEKGAFYTGFFQLAIGFERFAKLGLILDHMAHNQLAPPGAPAVKAMGHDIAALYALLEATAGSRGYTLASSFTPGSQGQRILDFLTQFAKGMRYANLDALASGTLRPTPLSEWATILNEIMEVKVPAAKRNVIHSRARALGQAVGSTALVIGSDLKGQALDFRSAFATPEIYDLVSPHVIWEVLLLLSTVREFVVHTGDLAWQASAASGGHKSLPYMPEFFDFMWSDRETQMRKKRWPD